MNNKYELRQFHFHWGDVNSVGSEHVVDDKVFAAEVRLIVSVSTLFVVINHKFEVSFVHYTHYLIYFSSCVITSHIVSVDCVCYNVCMYVCLISTLW